MEHDDGMTKISDGQADVVAVGILVAKCLACGCMNCAVTIQGCLKNAPVLFTALPKEEREGLKRWAEDRVIGRGIGVAVNEPRPPGPSAN